MSINQQKPGPLQLADNDPTILMTVAVNDEGDAAIVADVLVCNGDRLTDEKAATARLMVAAYNVFDGVGRARGMDAARLAENLGAEGLIELLRLAADLEPLTRFWADKVGDVEVTKLGHRAIAIFNRIGDVR